MCISHDQLNCVRRMGSLSSAVGSAGCKPVVIVTLVVRFHPAPPNKEVEACATD